MSQPSCPGRLNHADPDLGERRRELFAALVGLHGQRGRPVGSEALARDAGIRLSPASIRSALAELEGMGLLERAHASAGRVPTAAGYELYVRTLVEPAVLPAEIVDEMDRILLRSTREIEHLLNDASRLLSSYTQELGLAVAASLDGEVLSALELTRVDDRRAVLVLRLGAGGVRTLLLELDSPLAHETLAEVEAVLRERLTGRSLAEVRARLAEDPELARKSAVRLVARAAAERWARPVATPLFSAGARYFAEHPEFANATRLGDILESVEAGSPLDRLMVGSLEGQAMVRVGVDEDRALAACSLVSFALPGPVRGAIGVLGPLRMDYARALAVVEAVGSRLAGRLGA